MWYYPISALINGLASTIFGTIAYLKNPNDKKNKLYAFYCSTLSLWSYCYFCWQVSATEHWALFYARGLMMGAILIPIAHFHFFLALFKWKSPKLLAFGYISAVIYLLLNLTPLFVVRVEPRLFFRYWPVPGPAFHPYLVGFSVYLICCLFLMQRERQRADQRQKNILSWLFWATLIGYAGGASNFPLWYNLPLPPVGNILVALNYATIFYVLAHSHLMDIQVVIRKTLVYSLVSAALASVYVGTITLLVHVLGARHGSATASSSVLAAIFIALLFNPLRVRTQHWIDSRFPREHLDPDLLQEAAGTFAHEMKRPLSKISFPAQLALMELDRVKNGEKTWEEALPMVQQRLRFIIDQSIDAGYVIEAIRELSSSALPFEPVDVRSVVDGSLVANKDLLEKHGIQVRVHLSEVLPAVSGRAKQLEIVFVNLIKNAAEAMKDLPAGKKRDLTIEAQSEQNHVTIRVIDTGSGVKPEDVDILFHARHTTKGHGGTGLGLYLSRQILQGHNGSIEASSSESSGTIFAIKLPIASKTH